MPNKSDYFNVIISRLSSSSKDNFQNISSNILRFYYKQKGLRFEKVGAAGGDFKNDGWVPEKSIYYQIFSPVQFGSSFVHELYDKFKTDFTQLAKNVFIKHKWSGDIKRYYFLVNTRDDDIPRDDERIVENTKNDLEAKYQVVFDCVEIVNKDYIVDLLSELSEEQLKDLTDILGISGELDIINVSPRGFSEFINLMCNSLLSRNYEESASSFVKIPDEEKITFNDLQGREERINKISAHLGVVEEAIDSFTYSGQNINRIQNIINYCIGVYKRLKGSFHGAELYDEIINDIAMNLPNSQSQKNNVELFVVYIFDRCDIFERVNYAAA